MISDRFAAPRRFVQPPDPEYQFPDHPPSGRFISDRFANDDRASSVAAAIDSASAVHSVEERRDDVVVAVMKERLRCAAVARVAMERWLAAVELCGNVEDKNTAGGRARTAKLILNAILAGEKEKGGCSDGC